MKKENKDFNMIAYADIDQFIEIDLKDGSADNKSNIIKFKRRNKETGN